MKTEFTVEAMKGAPAIGGSVAAAMTLNQWIALATGVYIVIQAAYLVRKWWREEQEHSIKMKAMEAGEKPA